MWSIDGRGPVSRIKRRGEIRRILKNGPAVNSRIGKAGRRRPDSAFLKMIRYPYLSAHTADIINKLLTEIERMVLI